MELHAKPFEWIPSKTQTTYRIISTAIEDGQRHTNQCISISSREWEDNTSRYPVTLFGSMDTMRFSKLTHLMVIREKTDLYQNTLTWSPIPFIWSNVIPLNLNKTYLSLCFTQPAMRRFLPFILVFPGCILSSIGALKSQTEKRDFGAVRHLPFHEVPTPPLPDYGEETSWMALPWRKDLSDSTTSDIQRRIQLEVQEGADVFWIHPTTYFEASKAPYHWNAPVPDRYLDSLTDVGSMLYQASVFNAAGRLFAPKYRQAHIFSFYTPTAAEGRPALDTAYADVRRAFLYYLTHWNGGRPFIIASHSQGSYHGGRLVAEFMDRGTLRSQLIAAYLVGMPIPKDTFPQLPICATPEQIEGLRKLFPGYSNGCSWTISFKHSFWSSLFCCCGWVFKSTIFFSRIHTNIWYSLCWWCQSDFWNRPNKITKCRILKIHSHL